VIGNNVSALLRLTSGHERWTPEMARFRQFRGTITGYALILIAAGLISCSPTVPGASGLRAADIRAAPSYAQTKLSSQSFGEAKGQSKFERAAATKAINAKSSNRSKHHSIVAQDRSAPDRSQPSGHSAGAEPDSAIGTGATPPSSMKTPVVDSPEWKRDQQESEKQEQKIKRVIEGVCSGC